MAKSQFYVDPRQLFKRLSNVSTQTLNSSWNPDTDPSGRDTDPGGSQMPPPPPPGGPGPSASGGDFWSKFLAAIKPYITSANYDQVAGNEQQLAGLFSSATGAFGGEDNVLKYLGYNPLKGAYTALSFLNNTPYYDSSGVDAHGNQMYKPFYVPGYDYDPSAPGVQGPSWAGNQYDPAGHSYRT